MCPRRSENRHGQRRRVPQDTNLETKRQRSTKPQSSGIVTAMLTISKPLSAGQAQTYHQKEFTAKEQNYWSQRGVIAGEWQGRLAEQFGLAGTVSAEDFAKLSQGQHPQTGEQLVRQRASYEYQDADGKTIKTMEHRAGWDATFSAPEIRLAHRACRRR